MKFVRFETRRGRSAWGWLDSADPTLVREPVGPIATQSLQVHLTDGMEALLAQAAAADTLGHELAALRLLAPVPTPSKFIAVGRNYRAHAAESGSQVPEEPMLFGIMPSAVNDPYGDVVLPTQSDQIVCAPLFIERSAEGMTFRRVTGSAEPSDRLWWHRVGDHRGVVVERLNWLLFVAVNQRGNQEPSMIRLKWVPLSAAVLGGHATIFTPNGISFAAAVMRPAPSGTTFRQALRQSRKFHRDDPSIDSMTRMVLDQQREELLQIIARDVSSS